MTIILDATNAPTYTVEDYNGCVTLLSTPDLQEAVDRTLREARHYDAVIRLVVGNRASFVSLLTGERALLWKVYALRVVTFLLGLAIGTSMASPTSNPVAQELNG
jgi:hypothetical protein